MLRELASNGEVVLGRAARRLAAATCSRGLPLATATPTTYKPVLLTSSGSGSEGAREPALQHFLPASLPEGFYNILDVVANHAGYGASINQPAFNPFDREEYFNGCAGKCRRHETRRRLLGPAQLGRPSRRLLACTHLSWQGCRPIPEG